MSKGDGLFKECACGKKVHARAKKCECGKESPWKEVVKSKSYLVTKTFTISSPITITYKQGKILTNIAVIDRLLEGNAPIVEIEDIQSLITCPECGNVFIKE